MFKKSILSLVVFMFVFTAPFVSAQDDVVYIGSTVPYEDPTDIAKKILDGCDLPAEQAKFIVLAAKDKGMVVKQDDAAVKAGKGRILIVQITQARSSGNAWTGHNKSVTVEGKLMENGKEIAHFTGRRSSGGGFAGGYKGSCSVLNRCVKSLGKDIAAWLVNPETNNRIGE